MPTAIEEIIYTHCQGLLNPHPDYYEGRGNNLRDLNSRILEMVYGGIHREVGPAAAKAFVNMVKDMKNGSVIVDVSIDQGGCFATSDLTTHSKPTFVKHGVVHFCVPNIPSRVGKTASAAVSNILTPILLKLESVTGIESLLYQSVGLRNGVYAYKGCITNTYLGEKFDLKTTDLELLIASIL